MLRPLTLMHLAPNSLKYIIADSDLHVAAFLSGQQHFKLFQCPHPPKHAANMVLHPPLVLQLILKPRRRVSLARRLLALSCTFLVSGLMHEIMLLMCTGWRAASPYLGWQTAYFILQVMAIS